ncbi:MAG: HMA2 domain-containing protein, partial [Actinomycetota bacterium]
MDAVVRQRCSMPGRLRLDIAGMVSNPALAEAIEDVVRGVGHVRGARANPISGSLLVTYDPGIASIDFPAMIRSEIEAWLMKFGSSIRSVAGARRSALSRVLEISGQRPGKSLVPALLSVCAHSLTTVQNLSLALIITVAMGGSPGVLKKVGLTDARSQLKALTAAAMLLTIPGLLAHYSRRKAWRRLSQTAEYRLRAEVFTQLEAQDLTFFEEHGTG